jgi:hypothetical protein
MIAQASSHWGLLYGRSVPFTLKDLLNTLSWEYAVPLPRSK